MESMPPDPRTAHAYDDRPRHTALIVSGWVLAGVLAFFGLLGVMALGVPSDPCVPGDAQCGPEPTTVAGVGLLLLLVAGVAAAWSMFWHVRDRSYRFCAPPNWPQPPHRWSPPRGWVPPLELPRAPHGWQFWQ